MSFLLTALSAALLLALGIGSARADSFVDTLASNTTIPLPSQSCFYVDQFNGTSYSNTKLCSGWAKAIGALNATNNLSDLTSLSTARANLSLGSAAISSTGTSGATIPLLNGANTWSGVQSFNSGDFDLLARRWNLGDPSRDGKLNGPGTAYVPQWNRHDRHVLSAGLPVGITGQFHNRRDEFERADRELFDQRIAERQSGEFFGHDQQPSAVVGGLAEPRL